MPLGLIRGQLGLAELRWPRRTVDCLMDLASSEGSVERRPWGYTAARFEGLLSRSGR